MVAPTTVKQRQLGLGLTQRIGVENSKRGRAMKLKYCGGCDETKPTEAFGSNCRSRDGLQYWCKACKNEHSKFRKEAIKEGTWNR
jgi:hypothetical protein